MQKDPKAKKNKLIASIAIAVVLLGASAYMVFNNFLSPSELKLNENNLSLTVEDDLIGAEDLVGEVVEVERATAQALLDDLVKFGDWPVVVDLESLGRSNPFLPVF